MSKLIPSKVKPPLTKQTVMITDRSVRPAYNKQTVGSIYDRVASQAPNVQQPIRQQGVQPDLRDLAPVQQNSTSHRARDMVIPELPNMIVKGQKVSLSSGTAPLKKVKMCFGWNAKESRCDIDVSAFLLNESRKVPSDDWFVFYGQLTSPDHSVSLSEDQSCKDRQVISVDLDRLSPDIQRIVFVLTIHEALENHLNFSMMKDPYVRIMNGDADQVLYSYKMEELYENVVSMTIGELYLHNGKWKFDPVGNGVKQDLAGQCAIYGVQIG